MLTSNFKEGFFWIFKPLDNLFSNFFDFLSGVFTSNRTFPYKANTPALFLVIFEVFFITFFVACKFLFPELLIRFWKNKVLTVFMSVPKAAVYEDYSKVSGEDKVRFSRIPFVAGPVPKTRLEQRRANLFFRLRVP